MNVEHDTVLSQSSANMSHPLLTPSRLSGKIQQDMTLASLPGLLIRVLNVMSVKYNSVNWAGNRQVTVWKHGGG